MWSLYGGVLSIILWMAIAIVDWGKGNNDDNLFMVFLLVISVITIRVLAPFLYETFS